MFFSFLSIASAVVALANLSSAQYDYYRLPKSIMPISYNLSILTFLEPPDIFRFEGEVNITLNVLENSRNITLHAKNLTIDDKKIFLRDPRKTSETNCIARIEINSKYDYYIIHVCEELKAKQIYELSMPFAAPLNEDLDCYFKSYYKDKITNEKRWLSNTLFEPAFARRAFPCFDEPEFKAKFTISMGHHKKFIALSNMPLKTQRINTAIEDFVWSDFEESLPMSTYIVAYTVNDFVSAPSKTKKRGDFQFKTWSTLDNINKTQYAEEFGLIVLEWLEEIYGTKLPLKKLDSIIVPQFAFAGMENWGLISYKDTSVLYDPQHSTLATKEEAASLISHELAHQWFGNLVTMKWWTDLWLNEAFANYVASLIVDHFYPNWNHINDQVVEHMSKISAQDAFLTTTSISRPVTTPRDLMLLFNNMIYSKGYLVVRMMHLFIGNDVFHNGLVKYFQRFAYKNSESNDLWNAFNEVEGEKSQNIGQKFNVKTVMEGWLKQPGYPVVSITRDYIENIAKITQERFSLRLPNFNKATTTTTDEQCWWIPLSYTTQDENEFHSILPKHWLECSQDGKAKQLTIQLPRKKQWVIFNLQFSGLYRVNYDQGNWELLIRTLNDGDFKLIHPLNRARLIDDAFALASTTRLTYHSVLHLIRYLRHERNIDPWVTAAINFESMDRLLRNTPESELFRNFLRQVFTPIFNYLQGSTNESFVIGTNDIENRLGILIASWACKLKIEGCLRKAFGAFKKWQMNPVDKLPDYHSIILCEVVRNSVEKQWENLFELFQNTTNKEERVYFMQGLSCSKDVRQLRKLFEYTTEISEEEQEITFKLIMMNPHAINFVKDTLFIPPLRLKKEALQHQIGMLATFLTTEEDHERFKLFCNNEKNLLKTFHLDNDLQTANEIIEKNIDWMQKGRYYEFMDAIDLVKF